MTEVLVTSGGVLDLDPSTQFTQSAIPDNRTSAGISGFHEWWAGRQRDGAFDVQTIPFADLDQWNFDGATGNLAHESGRFFTVEGLRVSDAGIVVSTQPILNQPEIGLLGILAKEFNGVLHFLMQAKMEPGNVNLLQLSPTVQATRSNYTRVHRGGNTRYLEYFRGAERGQVLVDVLQSEQGAWFLGKRNRNMIVRVTDDVPEHEDFRWMTLAQIRPLLSVENLVGMDARTVLACMPLAAPPESARRPADDFTAALLRSYDRPEDGGAALHTEDELLSWFTEAKTACEWQVGLIPLADVVNWSRTDDEITDDEKRDFRIVAVRVAATNREIRKWSQPLLAPRGVGVAVFLARSVAGVLHLLVQAAPQAGLRDLVEIGPTVHLPPGDDPEARAAVDPFVTPALTSDPERVRFDTVLSEEGGRFYHAQTRYRIVEVGGDFPAETPENYRWVTVRQLIELARHGHYVNIEARSLLACVHSLW
jgi:dTDP-4-dehydro-6-deoxy-alpha-D-glucopyranose 2,3-dehydratase